MHTHMVKYNQRSVEDALTSLKMGYGSPTWCTALPGQGYGSPKWGMAPRAGVQHFQMGYQMQDPQMNYGSLEWGTVPPKWGRASSTGVQPPPLK